MSSRLSAETESELYSLYSQYTDSLKPLLAFVETKLLEFPGPILNELRAVNDHVSRCFSTLSATECTAEIGKAKGHLTRAMLDCYKLLLVSYEGDIKMFYEQYKDISLAVVNDGRFFPELKEKHKTAQAKSWEAKILESKSFPEKEKAYEAYQEAVLAFEDVMKLIEDNTTGLTNASQYARKQVKAQIGYCVLSAIIGCLLTILVDKWNVIAEWIINLFNH